MSRTMSRVDMRESAPTAPRAKTVVGAGVSPGATTNGQPAGPAPEVGTIPILPWHGAGHHGERHARTAMLSALADHDEPLHEHSTGVAELAGAVATRLELGAAAVREVVAAAELHDIGKLALPDSILRKPTGLDEEEWRLVRDHTLVGEALLSSLPEVRRVGRLVRSTHERWDGLGYPDGLAGEDIPLGSRIVFACDAYDAMVSARPYHRPKTKAEAIEELSRCAGTQFDARVVGALIVVLLFSVASDGREDLAVRP